MELRIMTEPQQGATYDQLLAVAKAAEAGGFTAFFRSDHYQHMGGVDPGPGSTDAWITLAGIARETTTLRLGTMVTPVTFRLPGPLAIAVATVDAMSGGRVELGLGTGWYDAEHASYGIPFGTFGERFEKLEEQLAIVTGLWSTPAGDTFSFTGRHYSLTDSPALPKPAQAKLPIVIGGGGPKRTPRLAATYADEFNLPPFPHTPQVARDAFARVRAACETQGRDPEEITYSACVPYRGEGAEETIDKLGGYGDAGAQRVYVQLGGFDAEEVERLAQEVVPAVS